MIYMGCNKCELKLFCFFLSNLYALPSVDIPTKCCIVLITETS